MDQTISNDDPMSALGTLPPLSDEICMSAFLLADLHNSQINFSFRHIAAIDSWILVDSFSP